MKQWMYTTIKGFFIRIFLTVSLIFGATPYTVSGNSLTQTGPAGDAVFQYHARNILLNQTGTILITTRISNKRRLGDIEIDLKFDNRFLNLESCQIVPSSNAIGSCDAMTNDGFTTLNWHSTTGQTGEFALWLLHFRAIDIAPQPTRLEILVNRVLDTEQKLVQYSVFPGAITIIPESGTGGIPASDPAVNSNASNKQSPIIPNTGDVSMPDTLKEQKDVIIHLSVPGRPFHEKYPLITSVIFSPAGSEIPAYEFLLNTNDGYLTMAGIEPGEYDLRIKGSNTLQIFIPGQAIPARSGVLELGPLLMGDVDDNNYITASDFSMLAASYNKCTNLSNINPNADLNADGCISAVDFSMLIGNYMKVGSP